MRHLILCFLAAFTAVDLHANPTVFDAENRPTTMLSENVEVMVGEGKSEVNGIFRFQQQKDQEQPPVEKTRYKHVTVFVPVLVPFKSRFDHTALFGAPKVEIAGRTYSPITWDDIRLSNAPESVPLPRGWSDVLYIYQIPLRAVGGTFEVRVSYVQPHFSNEIAAYVPIKPPRDATACLITFTAQPGRKLRPVSGIMAIHAKKDILRFTPHDRKLIRVQSLPVR